MSGREIARLKKAVTEARITGMIAAFDGEVLHPVPATTQIFIEGLRAATSHHRFQITCDAFRPYVPAISDTLGDRVSFAQLIKVYGTKEEDWEARYSPLTNRRNGGGPSFRRSRSEPNLHKHRRASEPHDQNADAPPDSPDEWVLEEVGEPVGRVLSSLRLLQLLPDSLAHCA